MAVQDIKPPLTVARRHGEPGRPLIRLEAVTKTFGFLRAVDAVSLDIAEGEFFALLGPSGCGKTTLLRMLAGFEMPDSGRILLDGQDIAAVPPFRRPVNMMFQSYALFPHLTVEGNIAFGLKQDRLSRAEIAARVREMLALVKLDGLEQRKPHQLSGGQRQRVALARSLAKRPRLLLLDEPLAALDRKLREETQFELMHVQEQLGLTFVIVTHDQEEAMTVADRIAVMHQGRLAQIGAPAEVYEQPASRWVAGFVGDVTLFEGKLIASAGGIARVATEAGELCVASDADFPAGIDAAVALRPEKLLMSKTPPSGGGNALTGTVADIGYLGDMSVYKIALDRGGTVKVSVANRTRLIERPIGWDDRVYLSFAPQAGVLLTR